MATPFKSVYSFDNIVKKYTLCGQCDGKISDKPFFICGCNEILCAYCSEKHSCGFHHQAIKYASYKHCKSINFIHDLLEAVHNNHEKEKEKKFSQDYQNLYSLSSCLPDLDDLVKSEPQEKSFSQLYDEGHCSRTEKPRATYSNSKRKPITSRIKYSKKRKFISDSEDEDNSDNISQVLPNNSATFTSSNKKRINKKMKYSIKTKENNFESNSKLSDKRHYENKINSIVDEDPALVNISLNETTDINFLSITSPLSLEDHGESSINQNTLSPVVTSHFNNNYKTDSKPSYSKESMNDKYPDSLHNKSEQNVILNIESAFKKELSFKRKDNCTKGHLFNLGGIDDNFVELNTLEDHIIENDIRDGTLRSNIYDCNVKQRACKTVNCDKKPSSSKQIKPVNAGKKNIKRNVSNAINSNSRDFDGFDQCEINASTLNYMLFKLTTPSNGNDEMKFSMNYQGRMFYFHTGKNIKNDTIGNGHHFLLTRIPDVKQMETRTDGNDCEGSDVAVNSAESSHENLDHANGKLHLGPPESTQSMNSSTDAPSKAIGCADNVIDQIIEETSVKTSNLSFSSSGVAVNSAESGHKNLDHTNGKLDFDPTESAQSMNSSTDAPSNAIGCADKIIEGTSVKTSNLSFSSSDVAVISTESSSENLNYANGKLHFDPTESAQSMNSCTDFPSKAIGCADNVEDQIIEGTSVKTSNLSFSSTNVAVNSAESSPENLDHANGKLDLDPSESAQSMNSSTDSLAKAIGCADNVEDKIIEGTTVESCNLSFSSSDVAVNSAESSPENLDHVNDKLHLGPPESAQSMNSFTDSPSKAIENSDNEDDEIIEGTPVKTCNLSFSSLDLSVMKERTLHFDLTSASPIKRDEVVSYSNLLNEEVRVLHEFCRTYGIEYSENFTNKTTHLVVSSKLSNESKKTLKYLMAIASKASVASMTWVAKSLQAKNVLPVDKYIVTNFPGPKRCLTNVQPPFSGLSIYSKLLCNYPGIETTEALCKLCGAFIVEDIEQASFSQNWPFPRFCLFEVEDQLTSQVLNSCSKNLIVAINFLWVIESIAAYKRMPILKHLCSTFIITDDIVKAYRIPIDLITDNTD